MTFSYFPGCSQSGIADEYGTSTEAVCTGLGIKLKELPDWSCCGASSGHMTRDLLGISLPARNLAIAKKEGHDIITVCAACYSRLKSSQLRILEDEDLAKKVERVVGADPRFEGKVRHLLDVIIRDVGLERIKEIRKVELEGLKAVPYYGCLLVRPREVSCCDSIENPDEIDRIVRSLGVEVRDWSYKTDCCGGSLSLSRTDIVARLVNNLFDRAEEAGANCIVTACPMCQGNLEMRQVPAKFSFKLNHKMPVFYFTELLGLAIGLPDVDKWLGKHLIDPLPLIRQLQLSGV
ncbi:MAG: CoB--CoM heterodisulfide reductase iron-sulfur subunit B family protein [Actinobacteria bacterium]|nr:CoB--CoM heterodisulfide reductase iron-sulfur subunit B family protein [Actinomycetota bacterium]